MSLLISTMNDVPGWRVNRVLGEVTGLTVRSRNVEIVAYGTAVVVVAPAPQA
jgi:uncharacterized protein YbjQ (UPF0145 family)